MTRRTVESLGHRQRAATPAPFAVYLRDKIRAAFGVEPSCLWVLKDSVYQGMGLDCWPASRNALLYAGPGPIIAHPPCGPWGKYRAKCHQSREHGIRAMELVHRFGGVVEQPVGSSLFRDHGEPFALIERVNQGDFGHLAEKATLLYWVLNPEE